MYNVTFPYVFSTLILGLTSGLLSLVSKTFQFHLIGFCKLSNLPALYYGVSVNPSDLHGSWNHLSHHQMDVRTHFQFSRVFSTQAKILWAVVALPHAYCSALILVFLKVFIYFEKQRACKWGRDRERESEDLKQAVCSVWRLMQGLISWL